MKDELEKLKSKLIKMTNEYLNEGNNAKSAELKDKITCAKEMIVLSSELNNHPKEWFYVDECSKCNGTGIQKEHIKKDIQQTSELMISDESKYSKKGMIIGLNILERFKTDDKEYIDIELLCDYFNLDPKQTK